MMKRTICYQSGTIRARRCLVHVVSFFHEDGWFAPVAVVGQEEAEDQRQ